MDKTKIFIWALYDFANSIVMIAFFLYFSQWLIIDRGVPDIWFNIILVISSLAYVLTGPVLGAIADKTHNMITGIRASTIATAVLFALTGAITVFVPEQEVLAMITFTLATAAYQLSFIYYNPLLEQIAPKEKFGVVSGWGLLGNYLGQICAVLIALPFATGAITLFGEPGRAQAFIPATLIFLVLALPLLISFKRNTSTLPVEIKPSKEYRAVWGEFKELFRIPNIARFFIAYFFFNDAVITASNNFPIYMERVFGVDDTLKSIVLIGILLTSAIGSPLSGWIADKIGFRKTLLGILIGWVVIFPILAVTTDIVAMFIITMVMGLWFGSAWTVTRAMVIKYTPPEKVSQSFTYYGLMERFATFIGPVSWGLIVAYGPTAHAFNYRGAAFAMALFVLIGFYIAKKLPEDAMSESKNAILESRS